MSNDQDSDNSGLESDPSTDAPETGDQDGGDSDLPDDRDASDAAVRTESGSSSGPDMMMDAAVHVAEASSERMDSIVEAEMAGEITPQEAIKEMAQLTADEAYSLAAISTVASTAFPEVTETVEAADDAEEVTEFGETMLASGHGQAGDAELAAQMRDAEAADEQEELDAAEEEEHAILEAAEEDSAAEAQMEADHAVVATKTKPAGAGAQQAHEAFISALETHAKVLGLTVIPQSSYYQFLDSKTGHKVYIAKTARDSTPIHIETTLELVGKLPGVTEPAKENGKIASVIAPKLDILMQVLDILASGEQGKVRAAKRPAKTQPTK